MSRRQVSVLIHVDGAVESRRYQFPLWAVRAGIIGFLAGAVFLLALASVYLPLARQAARVPGLAQEVQRLRTDNARIRELAVALDSAESRYSRLRNLVGVEVAPDPLTLGSALPVSPGILAVAPGAPLRYETGLSVPSHWPVEEPGYVTRGLVPTGSGGGDEAHPGLDIALAVGTLVRASGGGEVLQTGSDAEYGLFVLLRHPEGYTSRYGHLSVITAQQGTVINAGEVLGRSGNTGRSSAPHLHVEIRKNGTVVDPTTLLKEDQ